MSCDAAHTGSFRLEFVYIIIADPDNESRGIPLTSAHKTGAQSGAAFAINGLDRPIRRIVGATLAVALAPKTIYEWMSVVPLYKVTTAIVK